MGKFVFIFLCLKLWFISRIYSEDCGVFNSKVTCEGNTQCEWSHNTILACATSTCNYCTCGSDVPIDIVFALDASGSVGSSNFNLQRQWLQYIFNGQMSIDSRVAFLTFADNVKHRLNPCGPLCYWSDNRQCCNAAEQNANLISFAAGIPYTGGFTITQKAIEKALDWFNNFGLPDRKRVLVLLTDGQPNRPSDNRTVCQHVDFKNALEVQIVIVGIASGWINANGPQKVGCLVDDPSDMFYVENFNSFSTINAVFLTRLCPATNSVVITEVKPGQSDNFGNQSIAFPNVEIDNWRGRFLEIYNRGQDMSFEHLEMDGLIRTNDAPNFPVDSPLGSYVVFYEQNPQDSYNDISCYKCQEFCDLVKDCTEPTSHTWNANSGHRNWNSYPTDTNCLATTNDDIHGPNLATRSIQWSEIDALNWGGGRCWGTIRPALYIPCTLCSVGYSTYGCCFDDTMNEDNWYQTIWDVQQTSQGVGQLIDNVTYGSDTDWSRVKEGFSYELIQKTYPNEGGANWKQSCYEWGTPGSDPITDCPPKCDEASCRQGGNTNADCSGDGICICDEDEQYYANGIGCSKIPLIGICAAHWRKLNNSDYRMEYEWSGVLFSNKEYVLFYNDFGTGSETEAITAQTAIDLSHDTVKWEGIEVNAGYVTVRVIDERGNAVDGVRIPCPVTTSAPTESPTPAPTESPTPSPSNAPTMSPTAGPRGCFFTDCSTNPLDLTNVEFCECSDVNTFHAWGFNPECCAYNTTYQLVNPTAWGPNQFGSGTETGNDLYCGLQGVDWIPQLDPWDLKISCTPAPTLETHVYWEIQFDQSYCLNCPAESLPVRRRRQLMLQARRLQFNLTNDTQGLDDAGFLLTPISGITNFSRDLDDPTITELITVQAVDAIYLGNYERYSVYYALITSCENFYDGAPSCHPVYPNPIQITVRRSVVCNGAGCANTFEKRIPPYVWGIIGALIAFLLCLAALIYLFWWRTAVAKGNIADARDQINIEAGEIDGGFDGIDTGDMNFNALATADANKIIPSDQIGQQIDKLQENNGNEFAEVQDERFNVREAYGGQAGNAHF